MKYYVLFFNEEHEILVQDGFRTFDDFLREGLVEYLDVNEENNSLVYSSVSLFLFERKNHDLLKRWFFNIFIIIIIILTSAFLEFSF